MAALLAASVGVWFATRDRASTETRVIRVGVDHSPPFYSIGEDKSVTGLAVDVMNEAAKRTGYQLEWVPSANTPLDEALTARRVQMWPLVGATEERRRKFYLSDPWLESDYVLVSRKESPVPTAEEAAGKVVAQARLRMTTVLAQRFLSRSRLLVKLLRTDAIHAVCTGEASAALVEGRILDSILLSRPEGCERTNFHISAMTGATTPLHIIAVPELRDEARELRVAISDLIATGYLARKLDEWSPFSAEGARSVWAQQEANARSRLYRIAASIGFVLAGILAWLAYRGFRLKIAAEEAQGRLREAQRRFTAFMENSPAISFMKDAGGRLLYVNRAWSEAFHKPSDEAMGKDDFALFPEDIAKELRAADVQMLAEGTPREIIEQVPVPGGEMREMLVVKFPFSSEQGQRFIGGTAIDITERQKAVRALEASEGRYRELFENNPLPAWICDRRSLAFLNVNAAALKRYGWTRDQFLTKTLIDLLAPSDLTFTRSDYERLDAAHSESGTWSHQTRDGLRLIVEVTSYEMEYADRPARVMIARDITQQQRTLEQLRVSEERWQLALHGTGDALWDWDIRSGRVFRSSRWAAMLGYSEGEVGDSRQDFLKLLHPDDFEHVETAIRDYFAKRTNNFTVEYRLKHRNGSWRWILDRGRAIWDERDQPLRMAGSHTDITERKEAEELLELQAQTDPLTSLLNRREFDRLFAMEFHLSKTSGQALSVCLCDLDRFKQVNDTWGHAVGDRVLIAFAQKLQRLLRPEDIVARIGGDEFIIAMPDTTALGASEVAERIRATFATMEFRERSGVFHVTSSFGIAELKPEHREEKQLIEEADRHLYEAKHGGRNRALAMASPVG